MKNLKLSIIISGIVTSTSLVGCFDDSLPNRNTQGSGSTLASVNVGEEEASTLRSFGKIRAEIRCYDSGNSGSYKTHEDFDVGLTGTNLEIEISKQLSDGTTCFSYIFADLDAEQWDAPNHNLIVAGSSPQRHYKRIMGSKNAVVESNTLDLVFTKFYKEKNSSTAINGSVSGTISCSGNVPPVLDTSTNQYSCPAT